MIKHLGNMHVLMVLIFIFKFYLANSKVTSPNQNNDRVKKIYFDEKVPLELNCTFPSEHRNVSSHFSFTLKFYFILLLLKFFTFHLIIISLDLKAPHFSVLSDI